MVSVEFLTILQSTEYISDRHEDRLPQRGLLTQYHNSAITVPCSGVAPGGKLPVVRVRLSVLWVRSGKNAHILYLKGTY